MPTLVKEIGKRRRARRKRRVPELKYPRGIRLAYLKEIRAILADLSAAVSSTLPRLHFLSGLRHDQDDIEDIIDHLRASFGHRVDEDKIRRVVERVFDSVNAANTAAVEKQAAAVLSGQSAQLGLTQFALGEASQEYQFQIAESLLVSSHVIETPTNIDALRRAFIRENIALITKLSEEAMLRVERTITDGVRRNLTVRDLQTNLISSLDFTSARAELIARDQIGSLNAQLAQAKHRAIGLNKYRWRTSQDERVRASHAELDGQIFSYDKPPLVGNPGEEINCRCWAEPIHEEA